MSPVNHKPTTSLSYFEIFDGYHTRLLKKNSHTAVNNNNNNRPNTQISIPP